MRSSYYSDRRFKRGSLAHELCSKIEVTVEKEATSSTRVSFLFPASHPPYPLPSTLSPRRLRSLPLLIRREAYFAFVSTIYFLFGRGTLLPPLLASPPSPRIGRFNPVRSAEGNSQNLLLRISWIIINAYAVAGGIDCRVVHLLFLVLLPLPLLLIIILLCCHRWLPIRPFGKTTTMG